MHLQPVKSQKHIGNGLSPPVLAGPTITTVSKSFGSRCANLEKERLSPLLRKPTPRSPRPGLISFHLFLIEAASLLRCSDLYLSARRLETPSGTCQAWEMSWISTRDVRMLLTS